MSYNLKFKRKEGRKNMNYEEKMKIVKKLNNVDLLNYFESYAKTKDQDDEKTDEYNLLKFEIMCRLDNAK